jgi:hypothetical protein
MESGFEPEWMLNATFGGGKLSRQTLEAYLRSADQSPTECDGCSRLVAHDLELLGIPTLICWGSAILSREDESGTLQYIEFPHCWIKIYDDDDVFYSVDFRLRCYAELAGWTEEELKVIPHGIFGDGHSYAVQHFENRWEVGVLLDPAIYSALKLDIRKLPGWEQIEKQLMESWQEQEQEEGKDAAA